MLVQLLLFAIYISFFFFLISTHSRVRIIFFQSCWSHNISPIIRNTPPSPCLFLFFFSFIPALCLVLIKICKFPDGGNIPGFWELVYFSRSDSRETDSRETYRDIKGLPPFMSLFIQREAVIEVLDWPSTHSSSPGLHLPPPHSLSLSVLSPVSIFKIISRTCVLSKKYFHSNVFFFCFFSPFLVNQFSGWFLKKKKKSFLRAHSENALTLDCGEGTQGYFLSGNTI